MRSAARPWAALLAACLAIACAGDDDGAVGGDDDDDDDDGITDAALEADGAPEASDAPAVPGDDAPPAGKRLFVTSQRYPADLRSAGLGDSGIDGADRICQTL